MLDPYSPKAIFKDVCGEFTFNMRCLHYNALIALDNAIALCRKSANAMPDSIQRDYLNAQVLRHEHKLL